MTTKASVIKGTLLIRTTLPPQHR